MLPNLQVWLVTTLNERGPIDALMQTAWAWPIAESVHFFGLCLLIGTVGTFDLRLLGVGSRIPIPAVHRLIPWGLFGFALNVTTGLLFLAADPDQYIFNAAFLWKVVFLAVAGLNASAFYLTSYREVFRSGAPLVAPTRAKMIALVSLSLWLGVIVCGRLITFYRPGPCPEGETPSVLTCFPH